MKKGYWCQVVLLSCIWCACQRNSRLEQVLTYAGENRGELEQVLAYFQGDSLKYKAAVFLIENMPGHYSYRDTTYYRAYYRELDSVAKLYEGLGYEQKDSMYKAMMDKHKERPSTVMEDVKFISSAYLIDNIKRAVKVWQEADWARHVDFETFCEYILPYKVIEGQELDNWREYFETFCDGDLRHHQYCELYKYSPYKACETVNDALRRKVNPRLENIYTTPVKKMSTLAKVPFGLCQDYNILALAVMRAKGIPCVMDFTPQWPFRSLGHSWCMLLENSGKKVVFEGASERPASPHKEDHKMAKVFRNTYVANPEIEAIYRSGDAVPMAFKDKFVLDVTEEYRVTKDIEIPIPSKVEYHYAYITVFDDAEWKPVHWGKVEGGKVVFHKMGKDIVYLPVFWDGIGMFPFADPVLLTIKGETVSLKADTTVKRTMTLLRKFPPFEPIYEVANRVVGGQFQADEDSLFKHPRVVHTITDYGVMAKEIKLDSIQEAYQYWRYVGPDFAHCNIAELFFFEKDSLQPVRGKIIGTPGSYRNDRQYTREGVFDRNALTFFDAQEESGSWVGMDFGKPVNLEKIVYLPRSDGNCIEIGDEYELFYWAHNKWQSLGCKVADGVMLTYDNCPDHALFLLRDLTKGKEERIFTYEGNEQVWW